jgi:ufm1-conjugating enzyme 1
MVKYEFKLEFEIPPAYPMSNIELVLPELDGKTEKMYRGGKIC